MQVLVDGKEETAIAAYWVTDGEDCCCIGFLQRHMVAYAARYDGALAQVTRVLGLNTGMFDTAKHRIHPKNKGCCFETIIMFLTVMEKVEMKVEGKVDHINGKTKGKEGKKRTAKTINVD